MKTRPIHKTFKIAGDPETVQNKLAAAFEAGGMTSVPSENGLLAFHNPFFSPFSSKRPLSCISDLSIKVTNSDGPVNVDIGVTFTKIRYFFIGILILLCLVLPAAISYYLRGVIDIPPPSYLGIPLGFMVHYHVRWRVFHTIRRLIHQAGE